ncbi:hypothetical protein GCM10028806_33960 [Spirosoma terrae]|uniref:SGNH/GDSL hydrolase family protein n=1 Tax=Spirosoma terrae TaxID=1968276 RepID=A0A6L9LGD6_9BACT|nr:SGNH/GDSL hydrolase family protein [Spirosoma terrae]NDU95709.1 SGNH/GDSL hydrolase family protein [Spirosoma terrae]
MIALDFEGKIAVFFGDSMTEGYLAGGYANRWSSLLCAERNGIEDNQGVGGACLQSTVSTLGCNRAWFDVELVPEKTSAHGRLFLAYGTNDLLINITNLLNPTNFKLTLNRAVLGCIEKGWQAEDIVIHTGYWFPNLGFSVGECGVTQAPTREIADAYVQAAIDVARQQHCVLADVYHAMQLAPNLNQMSAEGLHINQVGHRFVADFLKALDYTPASDVITPPAGSFAVRGRIARLG